jgi:signal transduction histidine kinase
MQVELAEIAAGLPFAASFAMSTGISAFRQGRRRTSLNEAMHELRRPLQTLALSLPADPRRAEAAGSALQMTVAALERLDLEINGGAPEAAAARVSVGPVIASAVARWRARAASEGRSLRVVWGATEPVCGGDSIELSQAVDNLISNAFEHGGGAVEIGVREAGGFLRVAVRDEGPRRGVPLGRRALGFDRPNRRRHGHGLKIVRRFAARSGGRFRLRCSPAGAEAHLDLPLAEDAE